MTRELAIEILSGYVLGTKEQTAEAICMATEALEEKPEIIHCKDCDGYLGNARCVHNDDLWGEDDYCSHAERRK